MSLINDMLRDLEAKRPDDLLRQNLQREIRPLPSASRRDGKLLKTLILLGLPLVGLVAAGLHVNGQLLPLLGIATEVRKPVVQPALPVVPVEPATAAVDKPEEPISESLRLASSLTSVPIPAEPLVAVPDPVAMPVKNTPVQVAESTPAKEAPAQLAPATTSGPSKIEKSNLPLTPRDRAEAEFRKAEIALASGRGSDAMEAAKAALKLDAGFVPARQLLLRGLLEARKTDEAMLVLQEGLDGQPTQIGWAMSLARLQLEHGDLAAADKTLARHQAHAENNADYAGFQGHVKTRLGLAKAAVGHYQRATRLAPGEGRWWLGLGLALEADGKTQEAREAFRRSLQSATLSAELIGVAEQHLRP